MKTGCFKLGNIPWNKGKKTIKKCLFCQKEFTTNKGTLTKPHQKFCTNACWGKYKSEHSNRPLCKKCGKPIRWKRVYCKGCYKKEVHHWWKGGVTKINALARASGEYKEWRSKVFARDNYKCVFCNSTDEINAHHIKPFADYPSDRFIITNGITLCGGCHKHTASFGRPKK